MKIFPSKCLGVYIDKILNFKDHIQYVSKKNKFCGLMYRVRHMHPLQHPLVFHKAYAKAIINYGIYTMHY